MREINKNFYSTDKLYLLSPEEVYGTSFTSSFDTSIGTSRQLDYYEGKSVTTSNYGDALKKIGTTENWWWVRSASSSNSIIFYNVTSSGDWYNPGSSNSGGVSPAFRLAN